MEQSLIFYSIFFYIWKIAQKLFGESLFFSQFSDSGLTKK